jgi:hypothetical protein
VSRESSEAMSMLPGVRIGVRASIDHAATT